MLHLGDTTFWSHVTLIQPWKFIPGQTYWGKLIVHRWLCVSNRLWPECASFMKYSPLKTQWPWFALSISSKVKCHTCHKVNWKAIYNLLCVFHTNFDHMMHHLWDTTPWKSVNLIWPLKVNQDQKSQNQLKDHTCIWLCICASCKYCAVLHL